MAENQPNVSSLLKVFTLYKHTYYFGVLTEKEWQTLRLIKQFLRTFHGFLLWVQSTEDSDQIAWIKTDILPDSDVMCEIPTVSNQWLIYENSYRSCSETGFDFCSHVAVSLSILPKHCKLTNTNIQTCQSPFAFCWFSHSRFRYFGCEQLYNALIRLHRCTSQFKVFQSHFAVGRSHYIGFPWNSLESVMSTVKSNNKFINKNY